MEEPTVKKEDPIPEVPDNDLVGLWIEVFDTTTEKSKEWWWHKDSTHENGGYWNIPTYNEFLNNGVCRVRNRDTYKISQDTIWVTFGSGKIGDVSTGEIIGYEEENSCIAKYRFSTNKDTLYFEEIYYPEFKLLEIMSFLPTLKRIDNRDSVYAL
ncbi:MAG: hypothetical protein Q4F84_00565 [Fibrobacter sp.]|nr:hypothetical protein [Fibrobacter sp.]